jgi:hypothetical protein
MFAKQNVIKFFEPHFNFSLTTTTKPSFKPTICFSSELKMETNAKREFFAFSLFIYLYKYIKWTLRLLKISIRTVYIT